jgi:hypothetical protein
MLTGEVGLSAFRQRRVPDATKYRVGLDANQFTPSALSAAGTAGPVAPRDWKATGLRQFHAFSRPACSRGGFGRHGTQKLACTRTNGAG